MAKAKGNYFIVLDSDCILPPQYLKEAEKSLKDDFVHCYGGPDAAHESFSTVQKAINYAMTSFLDCLFHGSKIRDRHFCNIFSKLTEYPMIPSWPKNFHPMDSNLQKKKL